MVAIVSLLLKVYTGNGETIVACLGEFSLKLSLSFCKSATVTSAEAGQCVSLALKRIKRAEVRKGMVLVPKTDTPPRGMDSLSPGTSMLIWLSIFSNFEV